MVLMGQMTDLVLPPIYLLPSHLSDDELRAWEAKIPSLTRNAKEAMFLVGRSKHVQEHHHISSLYHGDHPIRTFVVSMD